MFNLENAFYIFITMLLETAEWKICQILFHPMIFKKKVKIHILYIIYFLLFFYERINMLDLPLLQPFIIYLQFVIFSESPIIYRSF